MFKGRYREGFQKISKAMDGLREAHKDVLVAVFWKPSLYLPNTKTLRPGKEYAEPN